MLSFSLSRLPARVDADTRAYIWMTRHNRKYPARLNNSRRTKSQSEYFSRIRLSSDFGTSITSFLEQKLQSKWMICQIFVTSSKDDRVSVALNATVSSTMFSTRNRAYVHEELAHIRDHRRVHTSTHTHTHTWGSVTWTWSITVFFTASRAFIPTISSGNESWILGARVCMEMRDGGSAWRELSRQTLNQMRLLLCVYLYWKKILVVRIFCACMNANMRHST